MHLFVIQLFSKIVLRMNYLEWILFSKKKKKWRKNLKLNWKLSKFLFNFLSSMDLLTMLLTSFHVLGPIARPCPLVVQKSTDAQLFRGGSVPTGPVPRAGSLVAEYTIEPVAMLGRDRWISLPLSVAIVRPPGIVAAFGHASMFPSENKTVWTIE